MTIDDVNYTNWDNAEKLICKKHIWYAPTLNENGYITLEANDDSYNVLLETNILSQKQINFCKQAGAKKLLIVFIKEN